MRFMFSAHPFKGARSGLGSGGFTLPEMAIVVVIAGLLLVTLLPALRATQSAAALSATHSNLQTLLRATAAYVAANGCLPCPTPAEKVFGFGKIGTTNNTPCGSCDGDKADGIPPFASLGLDAATAKDGWGRWITMHIDPALANPMPLACNDVEKAAEIPGCSKNDRFLNGFCKLESRTGASLQQRMSIVLENAGTAPASVVFLSHGANGYGSYIRNPQGSGGNCTEKRLGFPTPQKCPLSAEVCNNKCLTADNNFYEARRGENFDDILAYADRNALVSLLGSGSCTTKW